MAKTATFGVMHIITAFSITYAMTGSVAIAGAVTFVEPLANTVVHYFLDRYWDHPRAQVARNWLQQHVAKTIHQAPTQKSPDSQNAIRA